MPRTFDSRGTLRKPKPKLKVPGRPSTRPAYTRDARYGTAPAQAQAQRPQPVWGQPIDPSYDAAIGSAQRDFSQAMQGAQYEQGQLGQVFGLGITPQGSVYDDPSNPFSRAAVMQLAYQRSKTGTTNSYAASGQLYAGSLQNAQNENTLRHERGRDALIREFHAAQRAIQQRQLDAQNQLQDRTAQAQADSVQRAIQQRIDEQAALGAAAPGAPASAAGPKPGFQFVMKTGPRAGMSYKLVPGKGPNKGKLVRLYEDGYREGRG